jgi:outer membrane protein assembly factor BamD
MDSLPVAGGRLACPLRVFFLRRAFVALAVFFIAACSLLPEEIDMTADWSANRFYTEAKSALNDNNWEEAIKYYQRLESRYPYGRLAQQAQMEIAYAYWKSGDADSAIIACDRFLKLHPNHPNADYIYYLKGLINFNGDLGFMGYLHSQDQTERDPKSARESFEALKELVTRYPDSKYTPDAQQRLTYLVNTLAAHEVHVARYYYRRGAYIAAVNRSQFMLQNYPGTPAQEEALHILIRSYEKLGMEDLRADAERVMQNNYPQSQDPAEGFERKKRWWQLF